MGGGSWDGGTTGEGNRRRPAAVATAAREKRQGRRGLGQHATPGGAVGSRGVRGVVGRWRARAGARAQGSGSNGGRRGGDGAWRGGG
jgi:hypothetical protein